MAGSDVFSRMVASIATWVSSGERSAESGALWRRQVFNWRGFGGGSEAKAGVEALDMRRIAAAIRFSGCISRYDVNKSQPGGWLRPRGAAVHYSPGREAK